jgi:hypothetical protein
MVQNTPDEYLLIFYGRYNVKTLYTIGLGGPGYVVYIHVGNRRCYHIPFFVVNGMM